MHDALIAERHPVAGLHVFGYLRRVTGGMTDLLRLLLPYRANMFIDGTSTVAVAPYLVAHQQRQQCREPRALDGMEAA
ncbi:hypothetical protein [Streptomyces sp. DH10]|uniref:hypothetical protein n=1 Tax=Streptomyces sp. DH10 TaxID=3040121 RepID=UPI002441C118|nr:hypothetical protein [Streptomyces sp. DH10]MDG9712128.1 hypothetical protein [Streptomyces sp. DH10]